MRVSEKQRYMLPQARIGTIRTRQLALTEQLSSGVRLHRASDDPVAMGKVIDLESAKSRVNQYDRNIGTARHLVLTADTVLEEAANILYRAKELTIQSINHSLMNQDREYIANELSSLKDQLLALANTKTNNRYIFGGFNSDTPPYDQALTFVGDTNAVQFEVGDRLLVEATQPGGSAFGDGTNGTIDIFANLQQLEIEIRAGAEPLIQNEFEILDQGIEQMIASRQKVGLNINRLDGAESVVNFMNEQLPTTLADLRDVDFPKAVSELQMVENTLQATLAASSRLMQGTSLLDYL